MDNMDHKKPVLLVFLYVWGSVYHLSCRVLTRQALDRSRRPGLRREAPNRALAVGRGGEKPVTRRAEGNTGNRSLVAEESPYLLACRGFPDTDHGVGPGSGEPSAVR